MAPTLLDSFVKIRERYLYLTEVEAYGGSDDEASHAHRRLTPRNKVMFEEVGRLYVYFTYGMHNCVNVVAHRDGEAGAVLIRSGVGLYWKDDELHVEPILGPGRVGKYLGVTPIDSGVDVVPSVKPETDVTSLPYLIGRDPELSSCIYQHLNMVKSVEINAGPRVGISKANDKHWRFCLSSSSLVSKFRVAKPKKNRQMFTDLR